MSMQRSFLKIGDRFISHRRIKGAIHPQTYELIDGGRGFPMAVMTANGAWVSGAIEIGFVGIFEENINGVWRYYAYNNEVEVINE